MYVKGWLITYILLDTIMVLVLSHLNYALPVWGLPLNSDLVSCLCHFHNWAVRVTCGLRRYDHVSDCRLRLRWFPWIRWFNTMLWTFCIDIMQTITLFLLIHLSYLVISTAILHGHHPILLILCGVTCLLQRNFLFIHHILVKWFAKLYIWHSIVFSKRLYTTIFLSVAWLLYYDFVLCFCCTMCNKFVVCNFVCLL